MFLGCHIVTLMTKAIPSSEMSVLTGATYRHIPEDGMLGNHLPGQKIPHILYDSKIYVGPPLNLSLSFHCEMLIKK
jgi:hypothetical protein